MRGGERSLRRGLTLLEVLVALVLVGMSAVAWVGVLKQGLGSVTDMRLREEAIERATLELNRMALWSRAELAAHPGHVRFGAIEVRVATVSPSLYEVAITDSTGHLTLLATSFYRRD